MPKVLVVATSRETRGGITSVIKAHETGRQWHEFNCEWIETHIDGSAFQKIRCFIKGFFQFAFKLKKADIVHIHMAAVERKMPFVFLSKLLKKKLIIHLHFPDPQTTVYNPVKAPRYKWCLSKADKVIVLSESWAELLRKEWGVDNLQVIYNPCPKVESPKYNLQTDCPYILYAGNLSGRKGYKDLLSAFALVHDKMPGWRIKFAGNGEVENGKKIAAQLRIEDKVDFLGWVNGSEKDEAFRNAAVYCLPSYAEGFPMGVLDAWAYHLPVITTPVGGLPEILDNGTNALVFTPGNIEGLSQCLCDITSSDVREQLSKASENLSSTMFDVDNVNRQIRALYLSLID